MIEVADKIYSIEEYLELEKTSEIRHEFVYGKLLPMSGESKIANDIALNCVVFLRQALNLQEFKVYSQSVKVQVDKKGLYRYPDVMVGLKSDNAHTHLVTQPILLIEIVSESSADRDRVTKLREYVRIPSLQHYLIVDQFETLVESYRREGNSWTFEILETPEAEIDIKALDLTLSLTTIYEGIVFV
jgi:Uma2 family endonuclease